MDLWNSLCGRVIIELTSADPVNAIQYITDSGMILSSVEFIGDLTLRLEIKQRDLNKIRIILEKRGETFKVCEKKGIYWSIKSLFQRPVLVAGMCVLFVLILCLPSKVLFVQVEGNKMVPSRRILAAAEGCGIQFWASRRTVRSEQVKNALLAELPELTWAGVNTKGCTAVISVREGIQPEKMEKNNQICSIVAAKDGIVESCTATSGNMLCQVGQAVKAGDVLISAYTDCGICIRASRADGEIYASTREKVDVITLSQSLEKEKITEVKHTYSLLIGKKRINLWKGSGICHGSCDRMYEEYYITLPGDFPLPVAFVRETFLLRQSRSVQTDSRMLQDAMKIFGRSYLTEQLVAGKILNATESFYTGENFCRMEGMYLCREMIGRVQTEKIGE